MVFKNTAEGIINFREAVRNWASECVKYAEGQLTDDVLTKYREDYLADMDIEAEDYEDAEWHFDVAFRQAWEEESAEAKETQQTTARPCTCGSGQPWTICTGGPWGTQHCG